MMKIHSVYFSVPDHVEIEIGNGHTRDTLRLQVHKDPKVIEVQFMNSGKHYFQIVPQDLVDDFEEPRG